MTTCITCKHNTKNIRGERAGISPICNVPDDYEICPSYKELDIPLPPEAGVYVGGGIRVMMDTVTPVTEEKDTTLCNVEGFTEIQNCTVTVSEEEFTAAVEEQEGGYISNVTSPKRKGRKGKKAQLDETDEND